MQKLIALLAGILFSTALIAQQPDTSYRLLWYKGKKIKPNVLLTPAKDTVRFDRAKSTVKVNSTSGRGKQFEQALKELNKTPQRINEMAQRMKTGLPKTLVPAYVVAMKEAYTGVQQEFSSCLSNTMELPATSFATAKPATGRGPSLINYEPDAPSFEEALQQAVDYYEAHKNEKINFVPTPPRREFTYCTMNDKGIAEQYERDFEQFKKELMGKDAEMWQLMLNLYRWSEILLDDTEKQETNRKLDPLNAILLQRLYDRGSLLLEQFSDDPYRCWSLFKILMMIDRQLSLVGWYEEHGSPVTGWDFLENALKSWRKMFEKAMQEYDYPVALNLHAILSIERMAQMHDVSTKLPLDKLLNFNSFKLNMHVSAKLAAEGGYQLAELAGDNWYSAFPDSTGKLVWILTGPLVNKITMNLKAAEFRGKIDFPYIGTRKWESQLPKIKLDFCDRNEDSIDVYMFHAEGHKEMWQFPPPKGPTDILIVSGVLGSTFMDIERINQAKQEFKQDPAMVEKMKKEMLAKLDYMKKKGLLNASVPNDGNMSISQIANINDLQRTVNDMLNQSRKHDPLKFDFKPKPHNRAAVVLQEKLNGKELFPQNAATQYAWFHLKLEQDPNSPYKIYL